MLFPASLAKITVICYNVVKRTERKAFLRGFFFFGGMYAALYGVVDRSLRKTDGMPISACAAKTVLAVRKRLSATGEAWF